MSVAANVTWGEFESVVTQRTIVLLPVGSTEQHGGVLPLGTDWRIVDCIGRAVEEELGSAVMLLPTIPYGASPHHRWFPGTIDIGQRILADLVTAIGLSAIRSGARRLFVLNGHGGNEAALRVAIRDIKTASPEQAVLVAMASYWEVIRDRIGDMDGAQPSEMAHACQLEASLALHYDWNVDLSSAQADGEQPDSAFVHIGMFGKGPVTVALDHDELSSTGAFGDARRASTALGQQIHAAVIEQLVSWCREFAEWPLPVARNRPPLSERVSS